MTTAEWARRYAALGWRVYPVEPGRKKALFTGWQADATTDPDLIDRHWRAEPGPNIGLICGETFAVFDIEAPHLPALFESMDTGGHVLPETPVSSTGRGGLHLYVTPIAGISTTCQLRLGGVHIGEFKTTGGVVAPPSYTSGPYSWLWWPENPTLAAAPPWLTALVAAPAPATTIASDGPRPRPADPAAALDALACAVRDEPEGNRNSLLFWAACRAIEDGIRADIAEAVLLRAALAAGLPDAESRATLDSALKHVVILA